ncbi:MAG: methylmalonyl Co-A mutase-associated GTPase MeaB [Holophagales bacterium]|jgi:LAO/AO transport system kinase|nr:methylmalonyl Co-A mutase-associated GTPase MeaB [Holophagales bacterium]
MDSHQPKTQSALHVMPGVEGGHDGLPCQNTQTCESKLPEIQRLSLTPQDYAEGILSGDRTLLARAITLIESNSASHFIKAQDVIKAILQKTGGSIRLGITGVPGAGKSTFIETFGTYLTGLGKKVAVMAVDPSSTVTGGSILGDKTRMERLAADPRAFIRPTPSGGALGGVARKTRETMLLFEAAGYDAVIVETVGVGQSEITVRSMVDFFLLVLVPGAGDELQGIKKGVVELADAILINKADGANIVSAQTARLEYERAIHYIQPATEGWQTVVLTASSLTAEGIPQIWDSIQSFVTSTKTSGAFNRRRQTQERDWVRAIVEDHLLDRFYAKQEIQQLLPVLDNAVMNGKMSAAIAAQKLLETFESNRSDK